MKAQSIGTVAAWCGVCLIQSVLADSSAAADSAGTPEAAVAASGEEPAFEATLDYCTRQLTYGLVDNRDPIVADMAIRCASENTLERMPILRNL